MADSNIPMIVETGNNGYNPNYGFGGAGAGWLGAIGGLILGNMWGGNGLWGGRGNGQIGADVAIQGGIQNLSNQVQESTISNLQSNQATQNAINANAMANVQAQNASTMAMLNQMNAQGAGITASVNQNTISQLQGTANLSQQVCQTGNAIGQQIDQNGDALAASINAVNIQSMQNTRDISDRLCTLNNNITAQGYENRLQGQSLAAQLQAQHAALSAQIQQENCQDRELMRQIATEALQGKLTEAQARIVQLETQNYVNQSNSQQTMYLINRLAPTTTPTTGAGA